MLLLTPRQIKECLIRFRRYFEDRYGPSIPRSLGLALIDQAIIDYDVADDAPVHRKPFSINAAIAATRKIHGREFADSNFKGTKKATQLALEKKLAACHFQDHVYPVVFHFGGPEHRYTDEGVVGGLYLDVFYTEKTQTSGETGEIAEPAPANSERQGLIREILAIVRERLGSVSVPRLRRALSALRQRRYATAAFILFFGGCVAGSIYLYYRLSYDRIQVRGGDVIAERDDRGRLSVGYWQMWKANAPLAEFQILRDGVDVTARVRLTKRTYGTQQFYVFEDRGVELGKSYQYQIARGIGRERDLSPLLDVCAPCLIDRVRVLAGHAPQMPPKRIVELGELTHVSGVYTVGEPALFRIAAPGREGTPVDPGQAPPPAQYEVEADFGDTYTETFGSEIISHTWVKPGQYFMRAAPIHPSRAMYISIITVVNPSNGAAPTYSFIIPLKAPREITPQTNLAQMQKKIGRTIQVPRGVPISFLVDARAIPNLHDRRAGSVLRFDAGDGTQELYVVPAAPDADVARVSHTWDEAGFYVATFLMRHPLTGEIGARLIGVRVEPESDFERMRTITANAVVGKRSISDCDFPSLETTMALVVETGPKTALTGLDDPVRFDINADGCLDQLGWTGADSDFAFLWMDRDNDRFVDSAMELFTRGATPNRNMKPVGTTAFDLLREYDANLDGQIDPRDPIWRSLMLWWDRNHDGVSQGSEIQALSVTTVDGISLKYEEKPYLTRDGNHLVWNIAGVAFRDSKIVRNIYEMRFSYEKPQWRAMPAWDQIQAEAHRQRVADILKQRAAAQPTRAR